MSTSAPLPPHDPLGLDAPFSEGMEEADRFEVAPAWAAQDESPYAESPYAESPYAEASGEAEGWSEDSQSFNPSEEDLAWLDTESESEDPQAFAEDLAINGEDAGEQEYAQEWNFDAGAGEAEYFDDEERDAQESFVADASQYDSEQPQATGQAALKQATVGGFGRYRSEAAALAPAEKAKLSELARYVLWSLGPGRSPVRSIALTGHADRDVARGPDFETAMSRERALGVRALLANEIDRLASAHSPGEPPLPPFSARLHWSVTGAGARQLLVSAPRTEAERARNRRADIELRPGAVAADGRLAFAAAVPDASSIEWTFPLMLRFSKIVPADINGTNCCRAVQTASRLIDAANQAKTPCAPFNFYGSQLITAREYQAPFSKTRKCCQWSDSYWAMCRSEPYKSGCAHCGDATGPHLVLKYDKTSLQSAVDRIKRALDQGCTVAVGVLSGICDDKPEVGCARVAKADAWRQCPEHWLLILGYSQDTFLFWDSAKASALQTREQHHFGLLEYDRDAPRLSTARAVAGTERMAVDASGYHTRGYPSERSQKRYQVLDARNSAPCPAWDATKSCGEYDGEGRFVPRSCPLPPLDREDMAMDEAGESFDPPAWEAPSGTGFEDEAPAAARLSEQQRAWILDTERTAIERLPDAATRQRFLQQDWSGIEFPGNVPKDRVTAQTRRQTALGRELFAAIARIAPERRVPKTIGFRDRPAQPVPGQAGHRLYAEARDAFVRMRDAAQKDGVKLSILSSWRSRAHQATLSANQRNPNAVARGVSAHMYGLAIDLRMSVPGLLVLETCTRGFEKCTKADRTNPDKAGLPTKMANLVRMYRSPVYKWMLLRARAFGWYPYRNEPWHWEYNPPGLKARFEGDAAQEAEPEGEDPFTEAQAQVLDYPYAPSGEARCNCQHEEAAAPGGQLRTFTAKALGVKVAVLVSKAAQAAREVEMLVFAHGLDLCRPLRKDRPATFITDPPFRLGQLVEASGRPIVLVVPFLDWERLDANGMAFGRKWHRLAQPAVFNQVADEVLEQVRSMTGSASLPTLQRLILAGHSRAYGFFDALANAHASPQMRTGALGRPLHVWALDTTYSAPLADWKAWLKSREDLRATLVYRHGTYRLKGSTVERELTTGVRGKAFATLRAGSAGRLEVMPVAADRVSHCAIPNAYLPRLLAALPAAQPAGELEGSYEEPEAGEDLSPAADEAEWLEQEADVASGEWSEDFADEAEDAPSRFDAFGDERDSEWSSESSEEAAPSDEQPWGSKLEAPGPGLDGSGLTPAERKAVEITSLFETGKRGGFHGLSGNFDGQGLSFGLVNWTIGTGSLQPLLRDFAREQPARWASTFGDDASRFLQLIARKDKAARKEQHRFAVEQMNMVSTNPRGKRIWTVRQPWAGYFRRLSEDPEFQKIQVRYVRDLLATAADYCRRFKFTSEAAFCFMFDAVASHGKWWLIKKFDGVEKRRVLVEQTLGSLAGPFGMVRVAEADALLAIADVLATTSAQRWADKVRQRKRWFVTGQHPRKREFAGLEPRSGVAWATSTRPQRELEAEASDEAEAGEATQCNCSHASRPSAETDEAMDAAMHEEYVREQLELECPGTRTNHRVLIATPWQCQYGIRRLENVGPCAVFLLPMGADGTPLANTHHPKLNPGEAIAHYIPPQGTHRLAVVCTTLCNGPGRIQYEAPYA